MLKKILIFLSFCYLITYFNNAFAAANVSDGSGYLNSITQMFQDNFQSISEKFQTAAKALFFSLAVISLTWTFGQIALKGGEISSLMFEVMRATLVIGFFWWLITDAPNILFTLFDKFAGWVNDETGITGADSSAVIDSGKKFFVLLEAQELSWKDAITGGLFSAIVMWILGLILATFGFVTSVFLALNLCITLIEYYFLCYVGIFVLGVSGASWTRDIAISYIKKLIAVSLSYMSLKILCGITIKIVEQLVEQCKAEIANTSAWYDFFSHHSEDILEMYFTVFIVYLLVAKSMTSIPSAISNFFGQGATAGYNPTLAAGAMAGAIGYGGMKLAGMGIKGGSQAASHGVKAAWQSYSGNHVTGAKIAKGIAKGAAMMATGGAAGMAAVVGAKVAGAVGKGLWNGGKNLAQRFGGK